MIINSFSVFSVNNFHQGYEIITYLDQNMKDLLSEDKNKNNVDKTGLPS